MNGMNTRLTSGELLAIFVLSLFFLFGCSARPQAAADLTGRLSAQGAGSQEINVGTGKLDLSDSLDRRVAFRVVSCPRSATQTAQR